MASKAPVKKAKITFEQWAQFRAEDPLKYTFTAEGNGFIPAKEAKGVNPGRPAQEVPIPLYTRISKDEFDALWDERQARFTKIYANIETAKENLRDALSEYNKVKDDETGSIDAIREVVSRALRVARRERQLRLNRTREQWIDILHNPPVGFIDLENKSEARSVGGMLGFENVYICKRAFFPAQDFLKETTTEEIAAQAGGGEEDAEYGVITDDIVLGIHWPVELQVGPVKYFTAYQAILGELANQSGDKALFESILGTRSKRTLHLLTKGLTAEKIDPEIVKKVLDSLVKREDFREALLGTGTKPLLFAEEDEPLFGIGIDSEDPTIQNAKRWRGANLWGKALEEARLRLREKTVTETSTTDEPEDEVMASVITEAEQLAAKKGAIINQRRFQRR